MKILILTNHQVGLFKFRRELLEKLVSDGHKIYVSAPESDYTTEIERIGVTFISNYYLDRRGANPFKDLRLYCYYGKILKKLKPDLVLTYTIKPNVYGGYVCRKGHIPYIANVTGLGTSIEQRSLMQLFILRLYKVGLKGAKKVFFQNTKNLGFMLEHGIVEEAKTDVLPGSGVNTDEYYYEPYPESDEKIVFTTIGRIMRDKGILEILDAAKIIKQNYNNVLFRLIGDYDDDSLKHEVEQAKENKILDHIPFQKEIKPYIRSSHAILHASYHEGMSNVLLEAASSGRPVIATNVPGCAETFEPWVTGVSFEPGNVESLVSAIEEFLSLSHDKKEQMGRLGREKAIREFDRKIVVQKYVDEISRIR